MSVQKIKFSNSHHSVFLPTLRKRVDQYFLTNGIKKTGGTPSILKAIFMLSLYLVPYGLLLSGQFSTASMIALCVLMGLGVAGVGMSVMHDAIHGSLTNSATLNRLFGYSIYLLGGNAYNWEVQHNRLHHTFTNIHEVDEDITGKFMLRLSFGDRLKKIHRFQHIYAFFLYSLMTISFLWKDFKEIPLFREMAKSGMTKGFPRKQLVILIVSKLAYVLFACVIPLLMAHISFSNWLVGFLIVHLVAGIILSTIFQMAHVVEGAHQPTPDSYGNIENAWAVHQLSTTSNFADQNRLFSWFVGGLDYQIEHHLFPSISHTHYRALSPIIKSTAQEFGLTYNAKANFASALRSHVRMLKTLGTQPELEVVPVAVSV